MQGSASVQPVCICVCLCVCGDGECLCCFEVSNDRQVAVRANGRGQPGMMGTQREQHSAAQRSPTVETRHTALLQCSYRERVTMRAQSKHTKMWTHIPMCGLPLSGHWLIFIPYLQPFALTLTHMNTYSSLPYFMCP